VSLYTIKQKLLALKEKNLLDKVKLIILTNCTFDGLVYNVQQYMEEILAIKPDIIFIWDEAWFSFARCVPHYRLRTSMHAAATLEKKYQSSSYQEQFEQFRSSLENAPDQEEFILNNHLLPDPSLVQIRAYATQSIHKSLSCLRQGSMIHIFDQSFHKLREDFIQAYVTHSTTSPNYQIIATMDLARRQAELEGFELVQHAIELAMIFRQQLNHHPFLSQYFQAAGPSELIPAKFRLHSMVKSGYDPSTDWETVERAWIEDDIVIDPTRVTLVIKDILTGPQLRTILMDRFGIQVNKVSFKSILLQFNIGTSRSSVSYLLDSLYALAKEFEFKKLSKEIELRPALPPLPKFSDFAIEYLPFPDIDVGDLRRAYYEGMEESLTEYLTLSQISSIIAQNQKVICASIIIPTPPGYPLLLP
jgi:arginine decarboxylase